MVAVVVLRRLGDGSAAGMICLILSTAWMRLEACRGAEDAMAGWVGNPIPLEFIPAKDRQEIERDEQRYILISRE